VACSGGKKQINVEFDGSLENGHLYDQVGYISSLKIKVDFRNGSDLCPMTIFGIRGIEPSSCYVIV
jgi:hypothetical protein